MADMGLRTSSTERQWWFLGLMAIAWVLLGRLGDFPLFDVDEGAFAEASREMLESGDWWHTTLNGADRFDKPILVYWFQAAAIHLLGVNEWAVRLPSALCAVGSLGALVWHARRLWPEAASERGWLAAGLLGTSAGFVLIGRAATADAVLNALLLLGGLRLALFATQGGLRDLRWAAVWVGLGVLAKGPVALLIPGATLLLWSISTDRGARFRQALADGTSWVLLLLVALPWYVYAWHRHGDAFTEGFFWRHNLERFVGPLEGHGGSLLYYVVALPLLWLPWSALLFSLAWWGRRFWADKTDRFLLIWVVFVVVFFSLSGTKLPHYVLYAGMPIALLTARVLLDEQGGWARQIGLMAGMLLTPVLWVAMIGAVPYLALQIDPSPVRQLLNTAPNTSKVLGWGALAFFGVALSLFIPACKGPKRWLLPSGVCAVLLAWVVVPWWGETLQGPAKAAGLWARSQAWVSTTQWGLHLPSVGFYRQSATPRQAPQNGQWGLVQTMPADGAAVALGFESRGLRWVSPVSPTPALPEPFFPKPAQAP